MKDEQTVTQKMQMLKGFLRLKCGLTFDAMEASFAIRREWGIRVDWHDFASVLENLERDSVARRILPNGPDGFYRYSIG